MKFFSKPVTTAFSKVVATFFIMSLLFNHSFCRAQTLEFTETYDIEFSDVVDDVDDDRRGGIDVAISGNGLYMAVGAFRGGDKNKGYVKLYSKQGGANWSTMQQIEGKANWNRFGFSVDLSEDGSILAITSLNRTAYVYQFSDSSSEYEEIFDEDCTAQEVAVSPDGSVIAVALDDSNDNIGAMIFERNGTTFQQRGIVFSGKGKSGGIALSKDGSTLIFADRNDKGRVWVYEWDDNQETWDRLGNVLRGENDNDSLGFGECVSITHDGRTISIGAPRYDMNGNNKGLVRVYKYRTNNDRWRQIGNDLIGDNARDRFSTNALSSDGTYLIVGAWGGDGADYLKIFKKNGNNYGQIGSNVIGEGGQFAYAVDMSSDGSKFVVGANLPNDNEGKAYLYVSPPTGNGNGDPHFTTFAGTTFDYHGECDLVMLSSPSFASGSGLSIHVRTTRMDGRLLSYSYISGAAVAIGRDVLEVQQDGTLIVNGNRYIHESMSFPTEFATYSFTKNMIGKKKKITQYVLNLSDNNVDSVKDKVKKNSDFVANPVTVTIHANPKTRMLFVKIEGDVHDGIGLLGNSFARDQLLGRDGVTDMSYDWNTYGEEWQVRDTEPKLFQELRAPQYPETCIYYASDNGHMKKTHNLRRRLLTDAEGGIGMVSKEAANDACADYVGVFKENCIYDVMIMGDLEVAEDPSYRG